MCSILLSHMKLVSQSAKDDVGGMRVMNVCRDFVSVFFRKSFLWLMLVLLLIPERAYASAGAEVIDYPLWTVVPFVGMLLSIAVCPLLNAHWWEHNLGKVALFWAVIFTIPSAVFWGWSNAVYSFLHIMVLDYVPFLTLVAGLFVVAGGINIAGNIPNSPLANSLMLLVGAVLASIVGTTGATMLLIRPIISANRDRHMKVHTIIFLIFLVSNIGGSLTPIGDPPLFLGFLHGVPFFWTLGLLPEWILNITILLVVYFSIDSYFFAQHKLHLEHINNENKKFTDMTFTEKLKEMCTMVHNDENHDDTPSKPKITVLGLQNLLFLAGILAAVIFSGLFAQHPLFFDSTTHTLKGVALFSHHGHDLVLPYINIVRDGVILLMGICSLKFTAKSIREANSFTWGPVEEVGLLFAGIFATIIPALAILGMHGKEFGVTEPWQFFWATGVLSSFLDNAPTYLVFTSLASQLGSTTGILTDMGVLNETVLRAISCGAVFMGANTYIGNAPNFMTKSIAEENGIHMPSFLGYMLWSGAILIPLFILNTFIFFR